MTATPDAALAALPELTAGPPNPIVLAAAAKFETDSRLDQFGPVRPEPSLCFEAGNVIVIRDSWGEILGRVPIREINPKLQ